MKNKELSAIYSKLAYPLRYDGSIYDQNEYHILSVNRDGKTTPLIPTERDTLSKRITKLLNDDIKAEMTDTKPTIVITMEGGIIQHIQHSIEDLQICYMDFDKDAIVQEEKHEVIRIGQDNDKAYCHINRIGEYNPEYAWSTLKQVQEKLEEKRELLVFQKIMVINLYHLPKDELESLGNPDSTKFIRLGHLGLDVLREEHGYLMVLTSVDSNLSWYEECKSDYPNLLDIVEFCISKKIYYLRFDENAVQLDNFDFYG